MNVAGVPEATEEAGSGGPSAGLPVLRLEQAFYGSSSGRHDYRILAASPGLSREEREAVVHHSNLGGSAQTASDPSPIYTFYEADRRRRSWAFARTIFLGAGGRGNDYLVHALLLPQEALAALRGDLFLLEELDLFSAGKPRAEEVLSPLPLGLEQAERLSRRSCGEGLPAGAPAVPPAFLAAVLRELARGPVALAAESGRSGTALCRRVLAVLPPLDRQRLSFCTRFSHPRGMSFRLAAFHAEDRALAARFLAGFDPHPPLPRLALDGEGDGFDAWLEEVAQGVEPLSGISLLESPTAAAARAAALAESSRWLVGGASWIADAGARGAATPLERIARQDPALLRVITHPMNRALAAGALVAHAAFAEVARLVAAALAGGAGEHPLAAVLAACLELCDADPAGALTGELLAGAIPEVRALPRAAAGRGSAAGGDPLTLRTALVAIALEGRRPAQPAWIYRCTRRAERPEMPGRSPEPPRGRRPQLQEDPQLPGDLALLRDAGEAVDWIAALERASPAACLELLALWFGRWRMAVGRECLGPAAEMVAAAALRAEGGAVRCLLAALEAAAPAAGEAAASTSGEPERNERAGQDGGQPQAAETERELWFLALLREVRPRAAASFPGLLAARLAAGERLLGSLTAGELAEIVPALALGLPQLALELIARAPSPGRPEGPGALSRAAVEHLPWPVLLAFVDTCQKGLFGAEFAGEAWDVRARPACWELASWVALRAAAEAAARDDRAAMLEVSWLLWAASRLVLRPAGPIASPDADDRLAEALAAVLRACVPGTMDLAVRAAYRLHRFGGGLSLRMEPGAVRRCRDQAREDAVRESPHPAFRAGTLLRLAWLERGLLGLSAGRSGSPEIPVGSGRPQELAEEPWAQREDRQMRAPARPREGRQ